MTAKKRYRIVRSTANGFVTVDLTVTLHGIRIRRRVTIPRGLIKDTLHDFFRFALTGNNTKFFQNKSYHRHIIRFIDLFLEYTRKTKSPSRIRSIQLSLQYFLSFSSSSLPLDNVDVALLDEFANNLKNNGSSDSSIRKHLADVSVFIAWCIKKRYYKNINPVEIMDEKPSGYKKRMIDLSADQIKELIDKARIDSTPMYLSVLLALKAGMRLNEIISLEWKQVNFDSKCLTIPKGKSKTGFDRPVYLSPNLLSILRQHRESNRFTLRVIDGWKTNDGLASAWRRFAPKLSFTLADGSKLHFHDLRHVHAQSLLDAGISLEDVQRQLGHTSVSTTEKFYITNRRDLSKKIAIIDDVIDQESQPAVNDASN